MLGLALEGRLESSCRKTGAVSTLQMTLAWVRPRARGGFDVDTSRFREACMTIDKQQQALVSRAVRAPSSHNTQPWCFRMGARTIDLLADRRRALPVNDPDDRELMISCGAALMTLRVAAAARGVQLAIERMPAAEEPRCLARVRLGGEAFNGDSPETTPSLSALDPWIADRRTQRKPFSASEIDPSLVSQLIEAAADEGAWLRPLPAGAIRAQVAELVAEGDAMQWANADWRRELAAWMRPRQHGLGLSLPTLAAPVARWMVRRLDLGRRLGAQDRALTEQAPVLALLGTAGDNQLAWLRAGEALQRVLLLAGAQGVEAGYLNQPIQVAGLRPRLQALAGEGFPQLLLRLGYPTRGQALSPRLPLDAVMVEAPAQTAIDDEDGGRA